VLLERGPRSQSNQQDADELIEVVDFDQRDTNCFVYAPDIAV